MSLRETFRNLNARKRFAVVIILIYIVSIPIISAITYYILKQNAVDSAYNTARLYLASFEAARHYVGDELRPVLQREMPGKFIVEGMSRSYVAGSIARKVLQDIPGYIFKNASLNPRNPKNSADEFEREIINGFRDKKDGKEWRGLIERNGYHYYVLARSGSPVEGRCLQCHGDPAAAPKEMIERYGATSGFNMKTGEIVDALIAYIPVHIPLLSARKTVAVFIGIYTFFLGIVFWLIDRRFDWFYERIESDKKTIEGVSSEVLNLNREMEDIIAERTMGMVGMRIADSLRNPLTIIGGLSRQLLKAADKDEKLRVILSECRKMEKIVADFDELLRSKRFLFKREDLNEIVIFTTRFEEQGIKDRGIGLSVSLYDKPLMFNANRQLIKIAVRHIINNAVDATPSGGKISVVTGGGEDAVFLEVTDTGRGMTSEELHRIFEPFYSTKGRIGVGLPLVRQIITEHMGEVMIESKPDTGTMVRFTFPIRWKEKG
ncbi:MAG: DUF3365 domain-containing protein [Nitrospirae bacterium]|nr:DUF3365 domain-containing protein [Nitrospirota bacterium]